jgi:hypothetical protein
MAYFCEVGVPEIIVPMLLMEVSFLQYYYLVDDDDSVLCLHRALILASHCSQNYLKINTLNYNIPYIIIAINT